jgi:simple sugar transport system ATP-binding protein
MTMADETLAVSRRDAAPGSTTAALELRHVSKHFGGVVALDDLSLHVHAGEVVALVGDNGAGKSTTMKIVAGVHAPTSGGLYLDGEEAHFSGPSESRNHGIEVVYQDLALATEQSVYMNMFLGRELVRRPFGLLDKRRMRRESESILADLNIRIPSATARVHHLSGGQRQGIAIGRATHWARHLVLLDEPTAALGVQETARAEDTIGRMRDRGLAVLMVSHNLDQVFRLARRIYVLRRGRLVGERLTAQTTGDEIVSLITGSAGAGLHVQQAPPAGTVRAERSEEVR